MLSMKRTIFTPLASLVPTNADLARKCAAPFWQAVSEPLPPLMQNFSVTICNSVTRARGEGGDDKF
jgi:hypothetical protein